MPSSKEQLGNNTHEGAMGRVPLAFVGQPDGARQSDPPALTCPRDAFSSTSPAEPVQSQSEQRSWQPAEATRSHQGGLVPPPAPAATSQSSLSGGSAGGGGGAVHSEASLGVTSRGAAFAGGVSLADCDGEPPPGPGRAAQAARSGGGEGTGLPACSGDNGPCIAGYPGAGSGPEHWADSGRCGGGHDVGGCEASAAGIASGDSCNGGCVGLGLEAACALARQLNRRATQLLSSLRTTTAAAGAAEARAGTLADAPEGAEAGARGSSAASVTAPAAAAAAAAACKAADVVGVGGARPSGGDVRAPRVASEDHCEAADSAPEGPEGALWRWGSQEPVASWVAEGCERAAAGGKGVDQQAKLAAMLQRERARANALAAQVQELKLQAQRTTEQHAAELRALQSLLADELLMRPPTAALLPPPVPGWTQAPAGPGGQLPSQLDAYGTRSAAVAATSVLSPALAPSQLRLPLGAMAASVPLLASPMASRTCQEMRSPTWGGSGHTPVPYFSPIRPWGASMPLLGSAAQRDGDGGAPGLMSRELVGPRPDSQQQRQREQQVEAQLERLRREHAEEVALLESKHRQETQRLRSQAAAAQQRVAELMAAVQRLQGDLHVCDQFISWLAPTGEGGLDQGLEQPGLGLGGQGERCELTPLPQRQRSYHHHHHHHQLLQQLPPGEDLRDAYSTRSSDDGGSRGYNACGATEVDGGGGGGCGVVGRDFAGGAAAGSTPKHLVC